MHDMLDKDGIEKPTFVRLFASEEPGAQQIG